MKPLSAPGAQSPAGSTVARNVALVLLGVAGLLLRDRYSGPGQELVHSYGGNIAVSFAVYFIFANPCSRLKYRRALPALLALVTVELFEATDGFHVMSNVYDPADFLANGIGVLLAILADTLTSRIARPRPARTE